MHRTSLAAKKLALALLATAFGAIGCTTHVVGGAGGGDPVSTGGSSANGGSNSADTSCSPTTAGTMRECFNGLSGTQTCEMDAQGEWAWTTCLNNSSTNSTPLVLSFDGAPVTFAAGSEAFDLAATMSVITDWPAAATPWLALDRDGNGAIDDGAELFGSATVLKSGQRAANGFAALAELDSNGDGKITPEDAGWSSLRLWSDADGDRRSTPGELAPLAARRILSIDLRYTSERRCDARGNCEVERAAFRWADEAGVHTGAIVDVHLRHQQAR
jgi:hypothetical protein